MSAPTETATKATAPDNASGQADLAASAAEGRRLYIGNLAYATTEGELKTFFKDFLVEAVSIPTNPRTTRPVGYAFVDLSTPTEAERAISELNGQNILERKVSIQLARKPEPHAEGATSGGEGASGAETRRRPSQRGRGRGRGRGGRSARGGRTGRKDSNAGDVKAEAEDAAAPAPAPAAEVEQGSEDKTRAPRKQRGPPEDGIPSKTKVMVANLPYDLDEEKLKEIFKDYEPTHSKIALRPIPRFMVKKLAARGEARKGRGFGFVTLSSEEMQQKACAEMNGKTIDGREIAVKVAIDTPGKEDEEPKSPTEAASGAENAAPVKTEVAAAA